MKSEPLTILHIPSWIATDREPYAGNFIEKHVRSIARFHRCITLKVVKNSCLKPPIVNDADPNNVIISYFVKRRNGFVGRVINKIETILLYKKGVKRILADYGKPDLVHLHVALPNGVTAARTAKKLRVPLVLTEHWSLYQPQNFAKATWLQRWQLRRTFAQLSGFTAVSEFLRGAITHQFPNIRSEVIYNVVNTDLFCPVKRCKSADCKKTILHISTLDEQPKNISGMLRAIDLLRRRRQDFRLDIIHEKRSAAAERQVQECGLGDFVHFCGSKTEGEVAAALAESDFLLLFSNYETLSCVIVEALASGKPVVTTAVGGIREIVDPTRGLFVETANETHLVEQLEVMLDHFPTYDAENLHQFAVAHFSIEEIGRQFSAFYGKVMCALKKDKH